MSAVYFVTPSLHSDLTSACRTTAQPITSILPPESRQLHRTSSKPHRPTSDIALHPQPHGAKHQQHIPTCRALARNCVSPKLRQILILPLSDVPSPDLCHSQLTQPHRRCPRAVPPRIRMRHGPPQLRRRLPPRTPR